MNTEEKKDAMSKVKAFFSSKNVEVDITEAPENRAAKLVVFVKDKDNEDTKVEKFEELTLLDGSMVMIEPEVEAKAAIAAQTPEGEWVPAPAGAYELEDGRIVTVVEDGLIDSVTEVAADGEVKEVVEEEMNDNSPKRVIESIVKEKIFAKQDEFTALQETVEAQTKEIKFLLESLEAKTKSEADLKDEFTKTQEFLQENLEKLYTEPVAEPVKKNNNPLKGETKTNMFLSRTKKVTTKN